MKLSQAIKPISYLKAHASELIRDITNNHETLIITQNGEAKVVVQDIKSYENMQNSLTLLKLIIQSENDIERGNTTPQDKVFNDLEKKLFG